MSNRGGRRPGSGRKQKGTPKKSNVIPHPSAPPVPESPPAEPFPCPEHFGELERKVWNRQAPHAFQAGTLTPATCLAFERYCKLIVAEQHESNSTGKGGSNHRGLLNQINNYELQFLLAPCGKAMPIWHQAPPVTKPDEDDAFFGGGSAGGR